MLDRVLARTGGRNWWSVLLGRARAQRIWRLHREGMRTADALRCADNYSLASRTRVGFGRCARQGVRSPTLHRSLLVDPRTASALASARDGVTGTSRVQLWLGTIPKQNARGQKPSQLLAPSLEAWQRGSAIRHPRCRDRAFISGGRSMCRP